MKRRPVALVGLALLTSACATAGGERSTAEPLRARHALGVQRILVLAVAFPDVKPERSLPQIREHVLEKTAEY